MHALVRKHFGGLLQPEEEREVHRRLMDWYELLGVPPAPTSLEEVAPRLLAMEHALRAGATDRCTDLVLRPLTEEYGFAGWAAAWGHHSTAIELLGRVAGALEGNARASVLSPCAALMRQLGQLEQARACLDEAVELLDPGPRLALTHELSALAGALINRGNALHQLALPDEAIRDQRQALETLELLPVGDPERALHLPGTRMNLGMTLREVGRFSEAEIECRRAVEAYREQVEGGRSSLLPPLARAYTNLGIVLADLELHDQAMEAYAEAADRYQGLIDEGQRELVPRLAGVRTARAGCLTESGDGSGALEALGPALEDLRALVEGGRADLEIPLADAYLGRSQALLLLRDWPAAAEESDRVVRTLEAAIEVGRVDLDARLAHALANRAESAQAMGTTHGASEDLDRSLRLFEERIELGEAANRVMYLRIGVAAAGYLDGTDREKALSILERVVTEVERGLARDETAEALQLEARRSLRELESLSSSASLEQLRARLRACARRG